MTYKVVSKTTFEPIEDIAAWMAEQDIEEPSIVLADAEMLKRHMNAWIDSIAQRPVVLSFGEFNMWVQMNHDLHFTQDDGLAAWDQVVRERFPHQFEASRIIPAQEWKGFFEQYGGSGIVCGTIDSASVQKLRRPGWLGYNELEKIMAERVAVYCFSDPGEAMFARVAFV